MHEGLKKLHAKFDSFDAIARVLFLESDGEIEVSGNTVRRWFNNGSVPAYALALLIEVTDESFNLFYELHPWAHLLLPAEKGKSK